MFSHIAVSLSGGGIRATGFHLGMLDILDRVELLNNVHMLSSLSGGSLIGTTYALCAQEREPGSGLRPVQHAFNNLYLFLNHLNTMEEIFHQITGRQPSSPAGRRDLISGMSNMLDQKYFGNTEYFRPESRHFGAFWGDDRNHLKEIVFNAAEFKTGNAFRFQKSQLPCRIGNGNVWITEEQARKIRMADVLAASACIPAGMEPLFFPDDFHWPDDEDDKRPTCEEIKQEIADQRRDKDGDPYVALMDGGVYDNQGLTGILLAMLRRNKRRQGSTESLAEPVHAQDWGKWMQRLLAAANNKDDGDGDDTIDLNHLKLFIISDTPLRNNSMYPREHTDISYRDPGFFGRLRLGQYDAILWVVCILMLLSAGENIYELYLMQRDPSGFTNDTVLSIARNVIGFLIPAVVCGTLAAILVWFRRSMKRGEVRMREALPPFERNPWKYLKKLRLADVAEMIRLRVSSTSALTSRFFMHRIRQLEYSTVFASGSDPHSLSARIMTNEIYTLIEPAAQRPWMPEIPEGGDLQRVIEAASTMKTALWVDPNVRLDGWGELDILVAAGQATTCYNLMRHIRERFGEGSDKTLRHGSVAANYYDRIERELWQPLTRDPFCLVKELKSGLDPQHVSTCTRGCGIPSGASGP
jgi:predicted acylesterase/phospholipase RssA